MSWSRSSRTRSPSQDVPRKEASFSPVTLAWVLEQPPIAAMGRALGHAADEIRGLETSRQELVGQILAATKPDQPAAAQRSTSVVLVPGGTRL